MAAGLHSARRLNNSRVDLLQSCSCYCAASDSFMESNKQSINLLIYLDFQSRIGYSNRTIQSCFNTTICHHHEAHPYCNCSCGCVIRAFVHPCQFLRQRQQWRHQPSCMRRKRQLQGTGGRHLPLRSRPIPCEVQAKKEQGEPRSGDGSGVLIDW